MSGTRKDRKVTVPTSSKGIEKTFEYTIKKSMEWHDCSSSYKLVLLCFCHALVHLIEAVSSPPNTPQNLRIQVKRRPEPRRQPYVTHVVWAIIESFVVIPGLLVVDDVVDVVLLPFFVLFLLLLLSVSLLSWWLVVCV